MNSSGRPILATVLACLSVVAIAFEAVGVERLVPLCDLGTAKYRGETGGLYGSGQNEPPPAHRQLAKRAIETIQPLDEAGQPSHDGKIVFLSIGMSNTTQEFSAFVLLANQERRKRPKLVMVDGAQGGADATAWAGSAESGRAPKSDPWVGVEARLKSAGATSRQVQAVWLKQALAGPARYGEFPGHIRALEEALQKSSPRRMNEFQIYASCFLAVASMVATLRTG